MSSRLVIDGFERTAEKIVDQPLDELVILHLRFDLQKLSYLLVNI